MIGMTSFENETCGVVRSIEDAYATHPPLLELLLDELHAVTTTTASARPESKQMLRSMAAL
jgi:hypothetical protein